MTAGRFSTASDSWRANPSRSISRGDLIEIEGLLEGEVRYDYAYRRATPQAGVAAFGIWTPLPLMVGYAIAAVIGVDGNKDGPLTERGDRGVRLAYSACVDRDEDHPDSAAVVFFPGWTLED